MLDETSPRARGLAIPIDRLSLISSFVLIGLTLSFILDLPSQRVEFMFLGSEATINLSGTWLIALLLVGLTAAGVDSVVRVHPRVQLANKRYMSILWIVPALIVIAATAILSGTGVRVYGLIIVVLAGVFMISVIIGEYITIDYRDKWYSTARLGLNLIVYVVATVLFATIYGWKIRSLYSATAIGFVAGLLALELFRGTEADLRRTFLYAFVVGLSMGEVVWAFNYWNLNAQLGGALLLVIYYSFTGLTQQHLWNRLSRLIYFEFTVIILGSMLLLYLLRL